MGGRGARSAIGKNAIIHGTTGTISRSAAANALKSGFSVKAAGGYHVKFTSRLNRKYMDGKGRLRGPSPERLYHLGQAVTAARKANRGIFMLKGDNPPQIAFLHQTGKRSGMVVFADAETKVVRGFIAVKNVSKWENNLNIRKKGLPEP